MTRSGTINVHPWIMLAAVEFHNQPHFLAEKVDNVPKPEMLSAKFCT